MSLAKDFKAFVMRGNVIDLAVAVIIGSAFAKIVASFVNDILMPPLGMLLGGVDFKDLLVVIKPAREAVMQGEAVVSEAVSAVTWNYGMFVQNVIDFLIIAFAIFMVIRAMTRMQRKQETPAAPPPPPEPGNEEKLLSEIRDLLKK